MGRPPSSPTLAADAVFDLESLPGLAHEPFFAALANLEGRENSPEWRAIVAGLVVLRLVDRRIDMVVQRALEADVSPRDNPVDLSFELLDSSRQAVDAIDPTDAVRAPLRALCQAVSRPDHRELVKCVVGYAQALHSAAHWSLAADVYQTALRLAAGPRREPTSTLVLGPFIYDRLGRSLRMMGDLSGALAAYTTGRAVARAIDDRVAETRIRIAEARVTQHLGNLPAAAAALDAIISEVESGGTVLNQLSQVDSADLAVNGIENEDMLAIARHDRGAIAADQHDFGLAVEHYFAAWRAYRDPALRERAWIDIACALGDLGLRAAARDAHVALYQTGRQPEVRLMAAANLLELAVLDRRRDDFLSYQLELHQAAELGLVSARLAAWVALFEAQGEMCFGTADSAAAAFKHALDLASHHHVNEVVIRADRALALLEGGTWVDDIPTPPAPSSLSPGVQKVVRVVRRIRRRAGTGQPKPA